MNIIVLDINFRNGIFRAIQFTSETCFFLSHPLKSVFSWFFNRCLRKFIRIILLIRRNHDSADEDEPDEMESDSKKRKKTGKRVNKKVE